MRRGTGNTKIVLQKLKFGREELPYIGNVGLWRTVWFFCLWLGRLWKTGFGFEQEGRLEAAASEAVDAVEAEEELVCFLQCKGLLVYISGEGGVRFVYHPHWGLSIPPPPGGWVSRIVGITTPPP